MIGAKFVCFFRLVGGGAGGWGGGGGDCRGFIRRGQSFEREEQIVRPRACAIV